MCNSLFSCPLCTLPRFDDLETLKVALIKVSTGNLSCPICGEVFMGLDKLTIHLFSHKDLKQNKTVLKTEDEFISSNIEKSPQSSKTTNEENTLSAEVRDYKKRKNRSKNIHDLLADSLRKETNKNDSSLSENIVILNPLIENFESSSIITTNPKFAKLSEKRKDRSESFSEKCDSCGFFFINRNILEMHKKLMHNIRHSELANGPPQYCCHICSKVFKMKGSLMVHLRMVHLINLLNNTIAPSTSDENDDQAEDEFNKSDLDLSNDETKIKTQRQQTVISEKSVDGSIESNSGKTWKCDICEKTFTTKYFLKKHKRLHTGEMPYSCIPCNKTFTFQQSYHKHLLYHNDEKPHTCSYCNRGFKELSTLHNHQRIHTGEKPFECESCGKCFRQRVSYLVHRRIHTGVMPYKCTACDKSFRYKVSQRMHKCTVQPPGTLVRQSGELVQKLLKNQTDSIIVKSDSDMSSNNTVQDVRNILQSDHKIRGIKVDDNHISQEEILENICHSSFADEDCNMNIIDKTANSDDKSYTLDEIVQESISKIDFGDPKPSTSMDFHEDLFSMVSNQFDINNQMDESLPSPSERMKNLKLNALSEAIEESNTTTDFKEFDKHHDISYIFELSELTPLNRD